MQIVYEIDTDGVYLQDLHLEPVDYDEEDNPIYEYPEYYTEMELPRDEEGNQLPFYRPKWTGENWIENMSQEEIDALINVPREPSEIEKLTQENQLLKAQNKALTERADFIEDVVAEMAIQVYQ